MSRSLYVRFGIRTGTFFVVLSVISSALILRASGLSQAANSDSCGQIQIPATVSQVLARTYGSWTIQSEGLLSKTARERWSAEKPFSCPGAIEGGFFPTSNKAYVFLLVQRQRPDGGYRLIAIDPENHASEIEASDEQGSSNYFLHRVRTSDYFNQQKAKKFKPGAKDSFLMIDAAEHEYGADLYFWTEGRFRNEPVDE